MMLKFDYDQTNSHRVINKRFGVEEWWSYINPDQYYCYQYVYGLLFCCNCPWIVLRQILEFKHVRLLRWR